MVILFIYNDLVKETRGGHEDAPKDEASLLQRQGGVHLEKDPGTPWSPFQCLEGLRESSRGALDRAFKTFMSLAQT